MIERKPIQVPQDFVLCEDGTMWKWGSAYSDMSHNVIIPPHWSKIPNIPSDEEYEKQKEEREVLWAKIKDEDEKRLNAIRSSMNRGMMK